MKKEDFNLISYYNLTDAINRIAPIASQADVTLGELIEMILKLNKITARSGAIIGNSLKTIMCRIQQKEIQDKLSFFNIKVTDNTGNLLPFSSISKNVQRIYKKSSRNKKNKIAELLGGLYQINTVKALLK